MDNTHISSTKVFPIIVFSASDVDLNDRIVASYVQASRRVEEFLALRDKAEEVMLAAKAEYDARYAEWLNANDYRTRLIQTHAALHGEWNMPLSDQELRINTEAREEFASDH